MIAVRRFRSVGVALGVLAVPLAIATLANGQPVRAAVYFLFAIGLFVQAFVGEAFAKRLIRRANASEVPARRPFIVGVVSIGMAIAVAMVAASGGFRDTFGDVIGFAGSIVTAAAGLLAFNSAWRLQRGELPPPR